MPLEGSVNHIGDLSITDPANGDDIGFGDDHIRNIKKAVKADIAVDHVVSGSGAGKHTKVTIPVGSAPTLDSGAGILYTKDVTGSTELFYMDAAGAEEQLSSVPPPAPVVLTSYERILYTLQTVTTTSNTTATFTVCSYSVPGGTLGSTGGVEMEVLGYFYNTHATTSVTCYMGCTYGSDTVLQSTTGAVSLVPSTPYCLYKMVIPLYAAGSTSAQISDVVMDYTISDVTLLQGYLAPAFSRRCSGPLTQDSTVNQTLHVFARMTVADVTMSHTFLSARIVDKGKV